MEIFQLFAGMLVDGGGLGFTVGLGSLVVAISLLETAVLAPEVSDGCERIAVIFTNSLYLLTILSDVVMKKKKRRKS